MTGTVIFTIGVSLYPTVIRYMAGGEGTAGFGGVANWIVGLITFAVVFGLTNFGRGTVKLGAIFFGIVIGVLVSIPFGMVDPSDVAQAGWFSLPRLFPFPIEFYIAASLTLAVVYIMVNVQLIGDLSASTAQANRMSTERAGGAAAGLCEHDLVRTRRHAHLGIRSKRGHHRLQPRHQPLGVRGCRVCLSRCGPGAQAPRPSP